MSTQRRQNRRATFATGYFFLSFFSSLFSCAGVVESMGTQKATRRRSQSIRGIRNNSQEQKGKQPSEREGRTRLFEKEREELNAVPKGERWCLRRKSNMANSIWTTTRWKTEQKRVGNGFMFVGAVSLVLMVKLICWNGRQGCMK